MNTFMFKRCQNIIDFKHGYGVSNVLKCDLIEPVEILFQNVIIRMVFVPIYFSSKPISNYYRPTHSALLFVPLIMLHVPVWHYFMFLPFDLLHSSR